MANRFGSDWQDSLSQNSQVPKSWDELSQNSNYQLSQSTMFSQVTNSTNIGSLLVSSETEDDYHKKPVTPDASRYTVKPGSMSDSYRKRRTREREANARKRREKKLLKIIEDNKDVSVDNASKFPPERQDIPSNQTTMTQAFLPKSELELNRLEEKNRKLTRIKTKPHPFDPRDEVPDSALVQISRNDEEFRFEQYLDRQKKEIDRQGKKKKKKKGKCQQICQDCGNFSEQCHNVKYGKYCVDATRALYYSNKALGIKTETIVLQKVFVDHYNYAHHFDMYTPNDPLVTLQYKTLPACLKVHSFDDVMAWSEWKESGGWTDKKVKLPVEWANY